MISVSTKERLLQYLEFKGIGKTEFYTHIGIKRGLLDADKMKATISDPVIAKILVNYEDLDMKWLLTGEGSMLRSDGAPSVSATIATDAFDKGAVYSDAVTLRLMKKIDEKDAQIDELQSELRRQSAELAALKALRNKEAEYQSGFGDIVDTFVAEPSPDYGGGFSDTNPPPVSKKSSAGKTYK